MKDAGSSNTSFILLGLADAVVFDVAVSDVIVSFFEVVSFEVVSFLIAVDVVDGLVEPFESVASEAILIFHSEIVEPWGEKWN